MREIIYVAAIAVLMGIEGEMKLINNIDDLNNFIINNKDALVLITSELNEILGKAYFLSNIHAKSDEVIGNIHDKEVKTK